MPKEAKLLFVLLHLLDAQTFSLFPLPIYPKIRLAFDPSLPISCLDARPIFPMCAQTGLPIQPTLEVSRALRLAAEIVKAQIECANSHHEQRFDLILEGWIRCY
jgi:hypothetical protein